MKNLEKISFIVRMIFFVLHFYFVFAMLYCILPLKYLGYVFIIFYLIYVVKEIIELVSKKKIYREDFIYNFMQIGLMFYLIIFSVRLNISKIFVNAETLQYFRINYSIILVLIIFTLLYSFIELRTNKKN